MSAMHLKIYMSMSQRLCRIKSSKQEMDMTTRASPSHNKSCLAVEKNSFFNIVFHFFSHCVHIRDKDGNS